MIDYTEPTDEQILDIAKKHEKGDIVIGKNIPKDKLNNFKSVHNYTVGKALIFIDCSLFKSGKDAITITSKGIHSRFAPIFATKEESFTSWKEFFENSISKKDDEFDAEIKIGTDSILTTLADDTSKDEIFNLLTDLQTELPKLQNINSENADIDKSKTVKREPDISITQALQNPYQSMEKFIVDTFLYASPVYGIGVHFANNHLGNIEDEDNLEEFNETIKNLSDKHQLEKLIVAGENQMLAIFTETIKSTREDIEKIAGHDIGNIFSYNDEMLSSLQKELFKYRNFIIPKMNEMHSYGQQIKAFGIQNEVGTGQSMKDFIRGGTLGMAGLALMGPLGVAAAVGANYLGANEEEKKKEAIFDTIYDNWSQAHDAFYFTQLEEYYKAYKKIIQNISQQYISNYQLAHKLAAQYGKEHEYEEYIKQDITDMVFNEEFIEMREELTILIEFINNKGE